MLYPTFLYLYSSEGSGHRVIVVLANSGKEEIELELETYFPGGRGLHGTNVIVTQGNKTQTTDLLKINIQYARCIIILAEPGLR